MSGGGASAMPPAGRVQQRAAALVVAGLLLGLALLGLRARRSAAPQELQELHPSQGPLDRRHLAVVVNTADPLSEAIGMHYARARRIPDRQVIRVRFQPDQVEISPARFKALRLQVLRRTPAHVQVYALAWWRPYRVGCQSITSAMSFGVDRRWCAESCLPTRVNPYFARGDVRRPWDQLGIRPSMLLAARSEAAARRLIDRGVAADGTAPAGTAYLMISSDPVRNVRALNYDATAATLGSRLQVRIRRGDALRGARDVIAYFTGLQQVRGLASVGFRPGAIADHLTSFGGQLEGGPQMSALRWLEAGASGSYGTVVEPCNFPAKFPDPALALSAYRDGATLIEAYWRSVAMPGQGVFIGEPLARPWAAASAGGKQ